MNKVMLIGNVGREPEVKYYDTDQCVASFTLATTERGYTLPMVLLCLIIRIGIILFYSRHWLSMQRNIFIKVINSILRGEYVIVLMMIRRGYDDM